MDFDFVSRTFLIKKIGKTQMLIDQQFAQEVRILQAKLFTKRISGEQFWETYKKILIKSTGKNQKIVKELLAKVDKEIKQQFKGAGNQEKQKEIVYPDLSLPK